MTHFEDEWRTAILEETPSVDERRRMAQRALALARTPDKARRAPWGAALATAAAVAFLAVALWSQLRPGSDATETERAAGPDKDSTDKVVPDKNKTSTAPGSVDQVRARGVQHMDGAAFGKAMAIARQDKTPYALVSGTYHAFGADPGQLLAAFRKARPGVKQAFLFPTEHGVPGDVVSDRGPVQDNMAGLWFLQEAGIKMEKVLGVWRFRCGDKTWTSNQPEIDVVIDGTKRTLRVRNDSVAPILLPAGVTFADREIPGVAVLEAMDRTWRRYRRYLVRVECKALGMAAWVSVACEFPSPEIGAGNVISVRFGAHVFHGLRGLPSDTAQAEKKALIVVHYRRDSTEFFNDLLGEIPDIGRSQYCVSHARSNEIRFYDKEGKLEAVLKGDALTTEAIRKALR